MNWQLFRNALVNHPRHHERPQQTALIDHALGQVRSGLEQLGGMGHHFHLVEGAHAHYMEWPRLVFHIEKAPLGFFCLCEQDFYTLGGHDGGWFNTLDEAKHAQGMDKQFTRGGVFPKSGLPAVQIEDLSPLDRERLNGHTAPDGSRF